MYEQVLCRGDAVMQAFVAVCWCATHDREQDCSCSSNAATVKTPLLYNSTVPSTCKQHQGGLQSRAVTYEAALPLQCTQS